MIEGMDSNIETDFYDEIDPVITLISSNKKRRNNIKKEIPKLISQVALQLRSLFYYITQKKKVTHEDVLYIISNSSSSRAQAALRRALYLLSTKKPILIKLINKAKEVGLGIPRLIATATSYIKQGNDPNEITKMLQMSNYKIVNAFNAKLILDAKKGKTKTINDILNRLDMHVGSQYQKPIWITAIKKAVGNIPGSDEFAEIIYNLFCIFKDHQVIIDGIIVKFKQLVKVVRSYDEYVKETGVDYFE